MQLMNFDAIYTVCVFSILHQWSLAKSLWNLYKNMYQLPLSNLYSLLSFYSFSAFGLVFLREKNGQINFGWAWQWQWHWQKRSEWRGGGGRRGRSRRGRARPTARRASWAPPPPPRNRPRPWPPPSAAPPPPPRRRPRQTVPPTLAPTARSRRTSPASRSATPSSSTAHQPRRRRALAAAARRPARPALGAAQRAGAPSDATGTPYGAGGNEYLRSLSTQNGSRRSLALTPATFSCAWNAASELSSW